MRFFFLLLLLSRRVIFSFVYIKKSCSQVLDTHVLTKKKLFTSSRLYFLLNIKKFVNNIYTLIVCIEKNNYPTTK
jgi:hypothetical protein